MWHLGNFVNKSTAAHSFVNEKWPASHPGMHGFDEWHSTEASASSSMPNCGCNPEWIKEGEGCVIGQGKFQHEAFNCTNYWSPRKPVRPECTVAKTSTIDCVANLTEKIPGDDSEHIMAQFEKFLTAATQEDGSPAPFMAHLWLHTVHNPRPAMPEWYNAYLDAKGNPAGDYLGTLSQMDAQIGVLQDLLKRHGIFNDTMVWFTSDNGPHPGSWDEKVIPSADLRAATNGLRQCKGSVFEGGIRVPGIIQYPRGISKNFRVDNVPVYVSDYLPTILDYLGMPHPHPEWYSDGESIRDLIDDVPGYKGRRGHLVWKLQKQVAVLSADGRYKLIKNPDKGQCKWESIPYHGEGPFLFDLSKDPTETVPINSKEPAMANELQMAMDKFLSSLEESWEEPELRTLSKQPASVLRGYKSPRAFAIPVWSDSAVLPAAVLIQSLKLHGTESGVLVLCTSSVSQRRRNALAALGAEVVMIDYFEKKLDPSWSRMFLKLAVWDFFESHSQICLLDADTLAVTNIDSLFDECGNDRFICASKNPGGPASETATRVGAHRYFNGGLFCIRPRQHQAQALLDICNGTSYVHQWAYEQDFLNAYGYEHLRAGEVRLLRPRGHYNSYPATKLVHFLRGKPWFWYTLPLPYPTVAIRKAWGAAVSFRKWRWFTQSTEAERLLLQASIFLIFCLPGRIFSIHPLPDRLNPQLAHVTISALGSASAVLTGCPIFDGLKYFLFQILLKGAITTAVVSNSGIPQSFWIARLGGAGRIWVLRSSLRQLEGRPVGVTLLEKKIRTRLDKQLPTLQFSIDCCNHERCAPIGIFLIH
eukprot:g1678.t1